MVVFDDTILTPEVAGNLTKLSNSSDLAAHEFSIELPYLLWSTIWLFLSVLRYEETLLVSKKSSAQTSLFEAGLKVARKCPLTFNSEMAS